MEQRRRFDNNKGNNFQRRDNFNAGPRQMHKATCAKCKKECEVPFKPTEGRDVLCQECFRNSK